MSAILEFNYEVQLSLKREGKLVTEDVYGQGRP